MKKTLVLNESVAPKEILSEGLKYHMDNNRPLTEHVYRAGSQNYFNLWAEARALYSRQILEITNKDDLEILTETDLGHFGVFEGKKVPLDFPIELNEQMDIYDDIANMEFGMDYDQLGDNEKEWVRDEIDNMEYSNESLEEKITRIVTEKKKANKSISENRIIVKTNGKRLAIDKEDLQRLKSGKDIVGYSTKYPGQEEWILAKDKWEIEGPLNEAKKKSKKKNNKPLNKPMRDSSGGKAYKVYVKDPKTGNIKTVRFGSGGLRAKINDPKARQAFAKRHKCSTKKDKTKASYWSCRLPRYAKLLGLKSNFSGFW
jgi:hypothetical protein